jgi:hypothetical protein
MVRNLLIMSGLVAMTATAATAQSGRSSFNPPQPVTGVARGGPLDPGPMTLYGYEPPRAPAGLPAGLNEWQAEQLVRWGDVGKCVVARDRDASLSYVESKQGSGEALAAARRLDPVFDSCLAGSGISARTNKAYRRAAVADALGVRLST